MQTEEKIIRAALKQFEDHGFSAATTKAIAAEAGVAEVTLFRYFGDKKTLFQKSALYIVKTFGLMRIRRRGSGDISKDIQAVCKQMLQRFMQMNGLIRMLIFEAKKHESIFGVVCDIRMHIMDTIRQLIAGSPQLHGCNCTEESLEWLMSSLIGASLSFYMFHEKGDADAFICIQSAMIASAFIQQINPAGE